MFDNTSKLATLGMWIKDYENYRSKSLDDSSFTHTLGDVFYERASKLAQDTLFEGMSRQKFTLSKEIASLEKFKATPVKDLPQEALAALGRIRTIFKLAVTSTSTQPNDTYTSEKSKERRASPSFLDKVQAIETILQEEKNSSLSPSIIRQRNREFQQFVQTKVDMKNTHQATLHLTPYSELLVPTNKDLEGDSSAHPYPKQFVQDYISASRAQVYTHHFPGQQPLRCTSPEEGMQLAELANNFSKTVTTSLSPKLEEKFLQTLLFSLSQHTGNMVIGPYMRWIAELGAEHNFVSKISHADYALSPMYEEKASKSNEEPKIIPNVFKMAITANVATRLEIPQKTTEFTTQEINQIRDDLHIGSAVTGIIKAEYEMHMNTDGSLEAKNIQASYTLSFNKEQAL